MASRSLVRRGGISGDYEEDESMVVFVMLQSRMNGNEKCLTISFRAESLFLSHSASQ